MQLDTTANPSITTENQNIHKLSIALHCLFWIWRRIESGGLDSGLRILDLDLRGLDSGGLHPRGLHSGGLDAGLRILDLAAYMPVLRTRYKGPFLAGSLFRECYLSSYSRLC